MNTPINDYSRCLYIIIENIETFTSMQTVLIKYPFFYKWQARLHDLKRILRQKGFDFKITTEVVNFSNAKLNKTGYFYRYRCLNTLPKLKEMYKAVNVKNVNAKN